VFPVTCLVDGDTGKVMILDDGIADTHGAKAQWPKASGSRISSPQRTGAGPVTRTTGKLRLRVHFQRNGGDGLLAAGRTGGSMTLREVDAAQPSRRYRRLKES
jgi:hypothetical protein